MFIFIFQKVVFLWPPSYKWHHKQTEIMFQITKSTLSDIIYPIECTYIRIEDILWPRQILRAVKVRAIWWGKEPCSLSILLILAHSPSFLNDISPIFYLAGWHLCDQWCRGKNRLYNLYIDWYVTSALILELAPLSSSSCTTRCLYHISYSYI